MSGQQTKKDRLHLRLQKGEKMEERLRKAHTFLYTLVLLDYTLSGYFFHTGLTLMLE